MGRKFTSQAGTEVRTLLTALANPSTAVDAYRSTMRKIGEHLAREVFDRFLADSSAPICLVFTAEDADFLARGALEELQSRGVEPDRIRLVCFWNERLRRFEGDGQDSIDIAPVIKQYREELDLSGRILVVVSSIVSTARVVQTNLANLLSGSGSPVRTIVAAPVMYVNAMDDLRRDLGSGARSLEYVAFAFDDERTDDNNVLPGIGGSVFARLGFGERFTLVPEIIKQRRRQFAH